MIGHYIYEKEIEYVSIFFYLNYKHKTRYLYFIFISKKTKLNLIQAMPISSYSTDNTKSTS